MHKRDYKEAVQLFSQLTSRSDLKLPPSMSNDKIEKALKRLFEMAGVKSLKGFIETETRRKPILSNSQVFYTTKYPSREQTFEIVSLEKTETMQKIKRGKKPLNRNIYAKTNKDFMLPVIYGIYSTQGHIGGISVVFFLGPYFITAAEDCLLKVWDSKTGMLQSTFMRHNGSITDASISFDRQYVVSCDNLGMICLWKLRSGGNPTVIEVESPVEFVDFISGTHIIICVLRHGVVKKFNLDGECIDENGIMTELGEIRAICISEAGRFLLCGGMWPFVLLFDTAKLDDQIFTFDTDGYSILGLCASTNKPKFCASTSFNFLFEWEFTPFGKGASNMFRNRNKEHNGHWARRMLYLSNDESVHALRLNYTKNDSVITVCSDNRIRIISLYNIEIEFKEVGVLATHPELPLFAVSGVFTDHYENKQNEWIYSNKSPENKANVHESSSQVEPDHVVRFYDIDGKCISEKSFPYRMTDASFSLDGKFLVLGNEIGGVDVISLNPMHKFTNLIPNEQFFFIDFSFLFSFNLDYDNLDQCYDMNGNINLNWQKGDFDSLFICEMGCNVVLESHMLKFLAETEFNEFSQSTINCEKCRKFVEKLEEDCYQIALNKRKEDMGMIHITPYFYTIKNFKRKYLIEDDQNKFEESQIEIPTQKSEVESISSSSDSFSSSYSDMSSDQSDNETSTTNEMLKPNSVKNKKRTESLNKRKIEEINDDFQSFSKKKVRKAALSVKKLRNAMNFIDDQISLQKPPSKRKIINDNEDEVVNSRKKTKTHLRNNNKIGDSSDQESSGYKQKMNEISSGIRRRKASVYNRLRNLEEKINESPKIKKGRNTIIQDSDVSISLSPRKYKSRSNKQPDIHISPIPEKINFSQRRRKASLNHRNERLNDIQIVNNNRNNFPPRRKASFSRRIENSSDT